MTDKSHTFDLSIVITAHSEGLIAHKTMLSVFEAAKKLSLANITYEFIISIDNGTPETVQYFNDYDSKDNFTVIHASFKDLSRSRNNAVKEARGEYVTFLDADDLISDEWFIVGYGIVKNDKNTIAHPEFSITFADDNLMWQKHSSSDITDDTLCLIDNNLWDSPCMALRDVFLKNPYHPNGNGFGYEDKHFNCQTLAAGLQHVVAPQTLLFVRRKISGSLLRQASADLVAIAPTTLLSYENIKSLPLAKFTVESQQNPKKDITKAAVHLATRTTKNIATKVHNHAKKYEFYTSTIRPLREARQARILSNLNDKYPEWMTSAWRKIHKIDNQIFPSKELLKHLPWYNAENITPGIKYTQLIHSFTKKPDTLFFVPHLIKGGADMLFINYPTELTRIHPDWHIAMLQTEAKESVWKNKLTQDIDFINLYEIFNGIDIDTQHRLLATLLTQNDIKRIIIGNSQLAYDFVSRYQTLIRTLGVAIYCFAFGEEFDDEGRLWGHIHTGIPKIYPVVHRVITDNKNTVNKLNHEYGFDRSKFRVHYQPTLAPIQATTNNNNRPLKILWASRVCKQKRPDLLKAISNKLDSNLYTIDAFGQLEEGLTENYFADSQVNYKGPFNGSDSLPTNDYDVFLYTSEGDGVPNVLQEMTAAGLPIVASNVGGIREFVITGKTGMLIEDHEDIDDYVTAIQQLADSALREKLHNGAQELLLSKFSLTTWKESIATDFDR